MQIKFNIRRPRHWKVTTFRQLLEDIIEVLGATEMEYDVRFPDHGQVVFNCENQEEGRRIVIRYSDLSACLWRFNVNHEKRKKSC